MLFRSVGVRLYAYLASGYKDTQTCFARHNWKSCYYDKFGSDCKLVNLLQKRMSSFILSTFV